MAQQERAQCAVVVPAGLTAGSTFVVDLFDGTTLNVTVPPGKAAGDTLVIGSASTVATIAAESLLGKGQLSRICNLTMKVPTDIPEDRHLYVGSPFGGVYLCSLPVGVQPGQRISVQVPVYVEDEPAAAAGTAAAAAAAAAQRGLTKQGSSTLTMALDRLDDQLELMDLDNLLDRLDDDMALVDEEIQRFFVAGLEEITSAVAVASEGGGVVHHVVVGKLVRHRTDKWLKLNRDKSAYLDKHTSAIDSAALKERPGRQRHRGGGLLAGAKKAWKSLRSVRTTSRKMPKPVQV